MAEENKFEKYLLSEYENIAQAHFKSIETISTFFRHYLLIMSIPASAVVVFSQITSDVNQLTTVVNQYRVPISIVLFCVSFIGLGVFCYIVNLRLDVVLYARTVNGIRKFFYDSSDADINLKLRIRVLPQSPQLPSYFEMSYFGPVVFVFGVMNSLYFGSFGYILFSKWFCCFWSFFAFAVIFFVSHFAIYLFYARYREMAYLKSRILGVDIDGVLNKHRDHFCKLLKENTGKNLNPDQILIMPVHEYPALGITREEEREVFNDPKYWKEMPAIEQAAQNIRKLRRLFKLKIHIFTWRPWPDTQNGLFEHIRSFLDACENSFTKEILSISFRIVRPIKPLLEFFKEKPLQQITKDWLKNHGIKYNKFVFEKGNDYSSDPRGKFNNRFYKARMKRISYFVEDDLEKAIKLSYICDIVFLLSHPYNEPQQALPDEINALRKDLPSNIIRVKSWNEIYKNIRKLS